jgi:hypothetical protein
MDERKSTSAKQLRWLEDVHDDLRKIKVKGWGGKMKNREEWRQVVRRPKLTLSCSVEGKEGRNFSKGMVSGAS